MSSTRHADEGTQFRQEKFCSSSEFHRGLMANLVAKRCEVLPDAADRELIWWLQWMSHQDGGMDALANELMHRYPERNATPSMVRYGMKAGQVYKAEQVKAIRSEMASQSSFWLRGERDALGFEAGEGAPTSYAASEFIGECRYAAERNLSQHLMELCLDPAFDLSAVGSGENQYSMQARGIRAASPWYFPSLVTTLRELKERQAETSRTHTVVTALGQQVWDTLDYCLESRRMVLIDGVARTGKTFAAESWCKLRPGRARYVQVPSSADEIGFYRAIARSVGVSINLNSKAQQLRDRIEDVLHTGALMLCLDEAHWLWPQSTYRDALPSRVTWIMTALVNQRVPVALVTTPQFLRSQKALVKRSCWTDEQFTGRIGHYEKLPSVLSDDDLAAVARAFLPEGDARSIVYLVQYAQASAKYLAGIESVVSRARFIVKREGRSTVVTKDIRRAIKESVMPSDARFAKAMEAPARSGKRRISMPVETVIQDGCKPLETHLRSTPATRAALDFTGLDSGSGLINGVRQTTALAED